MARQAGLETAVMGILWDSGSWMTPSEVREHLAGERAAAYTTVMTALVRLWKKGLLERKRTGRAFSYAPVTDRTDSAAHRMEQILDDAGNRKATLARFMDTLSASERRELLRLLEQE